MLFNDVLTEVETGVRIADYLLLATRRNRELVWLRKRQFFLPTMSLSYPGSHRSSWCLGSTTSSTSSISSRPASIHVTGSSRSRLDYGTGSSVHANVGRHDYASTRQDVSRTGLYSSTSSRNYSRYGDSASGRSNYTGAVSHVSSGSVREVGGRRDSSYTDVSPTTRRDSGYSDVSPTTNYDVSSSYGSLSSVANSSRSHVRCRSNRNEEGGGSVSLPVAKVITGRSGRDENTDVRISSSVDADLVSRKREGGTENKGKMVSNDSKEDKNISSDRGSRRQSGGRRDETEHKEIEIQNQNSRQLQKASILKKRNSKDSIDENKSSFQKINDNNTVGAGDADNDEAFGEDSTVLTQMLCGPSPHYVDIKNSTRQARSERGNAYAHVASKSTLGTDAGHKLYQRKSISELSAEKLPEAPAVPSEAGLCFKNTSSIEAFSGVEEDILIKSAGTGETSEGLTSSRELHYEDRSRKPRANGTVKVSTNSSRTTGSSSTTANVAQAEIIRLESLCEARTKELTHTKMQLRATGQAFDAMAVLVNYCCGDLNAFECPRLAKQLDAVQKQLADCACQIADLSCKKDNLEKSLTQVLQEKEEASRRADEALNTIQIEREDHARVTHEMDDTHNAALTTQRDELTSKHDDNMKKLTQFCDRQIDLLRLAHDRQISDMKNESKLEMNALKISHLEEIQELRNKHDIQMEELHKQHRNKLEDITHRFESIKLTLSEKVESLRGECDELARRARSSEEVLQRDADAKVQIALAPFMSLPKEIESLKTVVEMRNEEIQKLRTKNMDIEKQLEEIPIAREKIISLQQKVENLEAIINIKTDHEKQLHEKCQILMRKYDRESRANKRLSMDYEQVVWRMSQSSDFGSCESLSKRHFSRSPPHSKEGSPDSRHRAASPNTGQSDVVMRVKKRSSHSISEGDRKLRSRSATFVVEKTESSDSHSPSSSPQLKQKRWRKKSHTEEPAADSENLDQKCHPSGAEILPVLPRQQKQQEEQMNSTSLRAVGGSHVLPSSEMASSYERSLSGVSDSGIYDSMTKSDALDSSIVSTDSEWGTSVNLSMNCDFTVDDLESGPVAGEYLSLNNITVIEVQGSLSEIDSSNVSNKNANSGGLSNHQSQSECQSEGQEQSTSYQFYVTQPTGPDVADDIVFDDRVNSL